MSSQLLHNISQRPFSRQFCLQLRNRIAAREFSSSSSRALQPASIQYARQPHSKPRVLEKPTRFNPPSHGSRIKTAKPVYYGAPLTPTEKQEQKSKQYPTMMPPEGSFMYWFLTNRGLHLWITMSTLFFIAIYTAYMNFKATSPFSHLMPAISSFFYTPLTSTRQFFAVYRQHTDHITAITAEKRAKELEDAQKVAAYRKAHGLTPGLELGRFADVIKDKEESPEELAAKEELLKERDRELQEMGAYRTFDGKVKKSYKKWFGIWE